MTVDATDMSTPVTRGELREELATFELRFEKKVDQKLDKLEQKIDQKLDQKLDKLEQKFDQKLDKLEQKFDQKLDKLEQKFDQKLDIWGGALLARITDSEQRLLAELARHYGAMQESLSLQISVVDEKYNDLPGRVRRLETKVFPGKRR